NLCLIRLIPPTFCAMCWNLIASMLMKRPARLLDTRHHKPAGKYLAAKGWPDHWLRPVILLMPTGLCIPCTVILFVRVMLPNRYISPLIIPGLAGQLRCATWKSEERRVGQE